MVLWNRVGAQFNFSHFNAKHRIRGIVFQWSPALLARIFQEQEANSKHYQVDPHIILIYF
jgi:hypothetical protein